jgi:hypothetical protein
MKVFILLLMKREFFASKDNNFVQFAICLYCLENPQKIS